MENLNLIASHKDILKRLDIFITENLENFSRTRVQNLIKNGNILINNKKVNKNYKLNLNDEIKINIPCSSEINILAENIPLDILYEDKHLIVVNKPQNMVVHPANGHYSNTLVNALMFHCKNNLSGINGVMRPGIVHRIDKDTSGILVIAKDDPTHYGLAEQLANHSMKRVYNAIICKNLKQPKGTIDAPIGRHPVDRKKMAVTNKNSKKAVTHYELLNRLKNYDLIKLKLETGRTHQIRVHMAHINHPILGDLTYGFKNQPFNLSCQTLHAKVLGFIHPITNKYLEFETDLPDYFKNILNKI